MDDPSDAAVVADAPNPSSTSIIVLIFVADTVPGTVIDPFI